MIQVKDIIMEYTDRSVKFSVKSWMTNQIRDYGETLIWVSRWNVINST